MQRLISPPAKAHDAACRRRLSTTGTTEAQAKEQCKDSKASSSSNDGNLLDVYRRVVVGSSVLTTETNFDKILVSSRRVVGERE